jgi:hypothetical protein
VSAGIGGRVVRVRTNPYGFLYLDVHWQGRRTKRSLKLRDTPAQRRLAERKAAALQERLLAGDVAAFERRAPTPPRLTVDGWVETSETSCATGASKRRWITTSTCSQGGSGRSRTGWTTTPGRPGYPSLAARYSVIGSRPGPSRNRPGPPNRPGRRGRKNDRKVSHGLQFAELTPLQADERVSFVGPR